MSQEGNRRERRAAGNTGVPPSPPPPPPSAPLPAPPSTPARGRGGGRSSSDCGSSGRRPQPYAGSPAPGFAGRSPAWRQPRAPGGGGSCGSRATFEAGRVFGGTVQYEKEGHGKQHIWKVGLPAGQRCQLPAFLHGLTRFVEYQRQRQTPAAPLAPPFSASGGAAEGPGDAGDSQICASTCEDESTVYASFVMRSRSCGNDDSDTEDDTATSAAAAAPFPPPGSAAGAVCISEDGGGGGGGSAACSRAWRPRDAVAVAQAEAASRAASLGEGPEGDAPLLLSLRLERLDLTDTEAGMVADWAEGAAAAGSATVVRLWLFGNRLGDEGAQAVARMVHPALAEIHLSHNMLTLEGVLSLLRALPAGPCPATPLWLRAEWNRISLLGLGAALQAEHEERGLLVDLPEPVQQDSATPSLPHTPAFLRAAKEAADAQAAAPAPAGRGGRNSLRFVLQRCHCRMPWVSSQFELPLEAAVLRTARASWQGLASTSAGAGGIKSGAKGAVATPAAAAPPLAAAEPCMADPAGPLLLIPDTSALLPMIGAGPVVSAPTFLTLELLASLADRGLFGRSLPSHEQIFIVVPASVAVQLDALKSNPAARVAVQRFMGRGLDEYGPAQRSFLTVLGAHEGEGLVLEHGAEVAGSRGAAVGSRGQAVDHKIVEVALFFQQELMRAMPGGAGAGAEGGGGGAAAQVVAALPVILLTGDHGQAQLAKAHGLPAVRMKDLAEMEPVARRTLLQPGAPLSASALRALLRNAAVQGLGTVAARSLQQEFDGAVACLAAATDALAAAHGQLEQVRGAAEAVSGAGMEPPEALAGVLAALAAGGPGEGGGREFVDALRRRVAEWQQVLKSYQSASRVLSWSAPRNEAPA